MKFHIIFGLLVFSGLKTTIGLTDAKLPIIILYESLCPDSISFIKHQLAPSFADFQDYIHILFVPFGKSNSLNGGEQFECQHGPQECSGNLIQSCALKELQTDQLAQMSYVACQMDYPSEPTGQACADSIGANFANIESCVFSREGINLQLDAEKVTKTYSPKFVPTIVYNYVFNQALQDRSLEDFSGVVCELIGNAAPICVQ